MGSGQDKKIIIHKKNTDMKQENFDYVSKQVFYTGFGHDLDEKLKEKMESGVQQFELPYNKSFGKDQIDAKLYFSKSEQGYYFFNKFDVDLQKENGSSFARTFYIDKENSYTLKEAYNLLDDRYVNKDKKTKEQEAYSAWDKLDFTQKDKYGNYPIISYGERYGFDLEKELGKLPIKALSSGESREFLMDSLKRGNRQEVRFEIDGGQAERHIEANVKLRRIEVYDAGGNNLTREHKVSAKKSESEGQGKSEKTSQKSDDDPAAGQQKSNRAKKGRKNAV